MLGKASNAFMGGHVKNMTPPMCIKLQESWPSCRRFSIPIYHSVFCDSVVIVRQVFA